MSITQNRLPARSKPRPPAFAVVVCLLLMCVSSYDAIHVHRSVGPLDAPLAPHHCLLCMAAHLPVAMNPALAAPVPPVTRAALLPPDHVGSYVSTAAFPLYIRPPPQI